MSTDNLSAPIIATRYVIRGWLACTAKRLLLFVVDGFTAQGALYAGDLELMRAVQRPRTQSVAAYSRQGITELTQWLECHAAR